MKKDGARYRLDMRATGKEGIDIHVGFCPWKLERGCAMMRDLEIERVKLRVICSPSSLSQSPCAWSWGLGPLSSQAQSLLILTTSPIAAGLKCAFS